MKGGGDYQRRPFYKRENASWWGFLSVGVGVGDKAVQLSVGAGIVPNNRKRGEIHELDV